MPRAKRAIVAAVGAVMGFAHLAGAQFWIQPADDLRVAGGGSNVNSTRDTTIHADTFFVTERTVITKIEWSGYIFDKGTPADVSGFWIKIYRDSDPAAGVFGVPGEVHYAALLPMEEPWITAAVKPSGDSPMQNPGWDGQVFYDFSADVAVDPLPPGDYWLSIAASMGNTSRAFVWARHVGTEGDKLVATAHKTAPDNFSQWPIKVDLAFALTGHAASSIDDVIALITSQVDALDLSLINAPNATAALGRRGALGNQFGVILRHIENEQYSDALAKLDSLSAKLDQWLFDTEERDELQQYVAELTAMVAALI